MTGEPSAVARLFGAALIAVGVLIALLSGGCTGWFLFSSLASFSGDGNFNPKLLLVSLFVGVPFISIGVALVVAGWQLSRGKRR